MASAGTAAVVQGGMTVGQDAILPPVGRLSTSSYDGPVSNPSYDAPLSAPTYDVPPPRPHGEIRPLRFAGSDDSSGAAAVLPEGASGEDGSSGDAILLLTDSGGSGGYEPPEAYNDGYGAWPGSGGSGGSGGAVLGRVFSVPAEGILANDTHSEGYSLWVLDHTYPSHGCLSLSEDGSFDYTGHKVGYDEFRYEATDGINVTNEALVAVYTVAPDVGVSGDSIIPWNHDDDDHNSVEDRWQYPGPLYLPGGGAFEDHDLKPVSLTVDGSGAHWWANNAADREDFQEVSLAISYTGPLSLWLTQDKRPLEWSYPIGASGGSDVPDTIYVEGTDLGEGSITLDLYAATDENPSGEVVASATLTIWVEHIPPTIIVVPIDTAAHELSPNELLEDDVATFLLTREGCNGEAVNVYLGFSGTADREDYQLEANGEIAGDSVLIPAFYDSVEVTLTALHDDMTADPDFDPETAVVQIAPAPDGSYLVGGNSSQTSSLYDTSVWKDPATNPQRKPFPDEYLRYHPAPPTSGASYTVVIVMGGALDGDGNERELWARQTYDAFPGAYVYNDLKNAYEFADVVQSFPCDSIMRLVLGGHGTWNANVGLQPTNNNTQIPEGYGHVNDQTISAQFLGPEAIVAIEQRLQPSAFIDIQSCGIGMNTDGAINLYNTLHRPVRYAVGSVAGWNTQPLPYGPGNPPLGGYWKWYPEP